MIIFIYHDHYLHGCIDPFHPFPARVTAFSYRISSFGSSWRMFSGILQAFYNSVRCDSFVNRPLGNEGFVNDLEKRFQMRLARGKASRPAKAGKETKNE